MLGEVNECPSLPLSMSTAGAAYEARVSSLATCIALGELYTKL